MSHLEPGGPRKAGTRVGKMGLLTATLLAPDKCHDKAHRWELHSIALVMGKCSPLHTKDPPWRPEVRRSHLRVSPQVVKTSSGPGFHPLARGAVSSVNGRGWCGKGQENWEQEPTTTPTLHPPREEDGLAQHGSHPAYPSLRNSPKGCRMGCHQLEPTSIPRASIRTLQFSTVGRPR